MSQWEDPEPTSSHPGVTDSRSDSRRDDVDHHAAERIQKLVGPGLEQIAAGFPQLVTSPRGSRLRLRFRSANSEPSQGLTSVSDSGEARLSLVLVQRPFVTGSLRATPLARSISCLTPFAEAWLGLMLTQTNYRQVGMIAPRVHRLQPGPRSPRSEFGMLKATRLFRSFQRSSTSNTASTNPLVERRRRRFVPRLSIPMESQRSLRSRLEANGGFVGFGIGQPLEAAAETQKEEGPERDVMLGRNNTLYSVSITMAPGMPRHGHRFADQSCSARVGSLDRWSQRRAEVPVRNRAQSSGTYARNDETQSSVWRAPR